MEWKKSGDPLFIESDKMACNAYLLACNVCKHDLNFIGQKKTLRQRQQQTTTNNDGSKKCKTINEHENG